MTQRAFISGTITRLLLQAVPHRAFLYRTLWFVTLSLLPLGQTRAQDPAKPELGDDVIRVNTELVQTDVMVFDKSGHFVGN